MHGGMDVMQAILERMLTIVEWSCLEVEEYSYKRGIDANYWELRDIVELVRPNLFVALSE